MGKAVPVIASGGGLLPALGATLFGGTPKPPKPVTPVNPLDTGAGAAQLAAARSAAVDQEQRRSLLGATIAGNSSAPSAGSIGSRTLLGG